MREQQTYAPSAKPMPLFTLKITTDWGKLSLSHRAIAVSAYANTNKVGDKFAAVLDDRNAHAFKVTFRNLVTQKGDGRKYTMPVIRRAGQVIVEIERIK